MRYYSKRYKCAKSKQLKIARLRTGMVRRKIKLAIAQQALCMLRDSSYPDAVSSGVSSTSFFYDFGARRRVTILNNINAPGPSGLN